MATIKDVAKLAGVSPSTVSRTLSKKIYVEEATRQKVQKAVAELNYKPNFLAKGLKEGRTKTLALILPDITNPFYPKLVQSIETHSSENGYSMVLYDTGEDISREVRYFEMLKSHYVDGVLFASTTDNIGHLIDFMQEGIPVVAVNREFDADILCVSNDNKAGAYIMVQYLIERGHRKICCMIGDMSMQRYRQRYAGCMQAFEEHEIPKENHFFIEGVRSVAEAYDHTVRLLSGEKAPTAFFATTDMLAIGIYSGVHNCGYKIPEDVSVVGFDNISMSQHMIPPLTTYEHPVDRVAKLAITELIMQIEQLPVEGPRVQIVEGSIVVRESVARNPRKR